ncbi:hypothetical protein CASFOL_034140 [Castilleja foliolosa]|uniref:Carboxypeptidase n=1 Tax=Castilleja foliolosa TaxID=1961234 RepID=A0ABD3BXB8_9LAMI
MSSSFLFCINLALLITFFLFVFAEATNNHNLLQGSIRGLNHSFGLDANFVNDETLDNKSEIVEKLFRFPSLANNHIAYLGQHVGYVELHNSTGGRARMFYYFFESRVHDANAPVVVWLTGGPGCSSSLALFSANGPFKVTRNLKLVRNEYSWDKVANIIFIDQPIGTGFSYSSDPARDIPTTSEGVAVNLYDFMQGFFGQHPGLANNDFYITGESYAGHYIPAFAAYVHHANKNNQGRHINLKGMAIGNGMTNSRLQYVAYPDYALNNNLISQSMYKNLEPLVANCQEKTKDCDSGTHYNRDACIQAYHYCDEIRKTIFRANPHLNGNWKWVHDMKWSGQRGFKRASEVSFIVNRTEAGSQKSYGNLMYLKVHNAGHMVPMDQPKAALEMLRRWIHGHIPL